MKDRDTWSAMKPTCVLNLRSQLARSFHFQAALSIFLPAVTHRGYTDHISFLIADREV